VISRIAPEFWQLYHELSAEVRFAARKAFQRFSAIQDIQASAWSDYALIRAHGQFALHEMFALLLFGAVMNGCGSGSVPTKTSTGGFLVSARPYHVYVVGKT
jgi:hypothetical protein